MSPVASTDGWCVYQAGMNNKVVYQKLPEPESSKQQQQQQQSSSQGGGC